jgi:hypothetical protein
MILSVPAPISAAPVDSVSGDDLQQPVRKSRLHQDALDFQSR